jgi:hypothetical protein
MKFTSTHVAGYKMIIAHGETAQQGTNLYSIDTGTNGNIFAGNYFDMNKDHLSGNLQKMLIGPAIQHVKTSNLIIKPKSAKPLSNDKSDL